MPKYLLSKVAIKKIEDAVDNLYDRAKVRVLGAGSVDKRIYIGTKPELTLPAIFAAAATEEGIKPDKELLASILKISAGYIDAHRAKTKVQTIKAIDAFLKNAEAQSVETSVKTVLQGELNNVWRKATDEMKRIVDTEASNVRNVGVLDGIAKINMAAGIEDPLIYFIVVRDSSLCDECRKLHLLEDGVTPRLWYQSEVSHDYHKKGSGVPSIAGEHPMCRCSTASLMPGYGYNSLGYVTFVSLDHDEMKKQRG